MNPIFFQARMSSVNDSTNNVTNLANEITEEEVDATKVSN